MFLKVILKVALKSLFANKLRSGLSMLGIIIGVGAVISMLALGAGAQKQVLDQITSMGTNLLVVRPGQAGTRGVSIGVTDNLSLQDAEDLLKIPEIRQAAPVVNGSVQIKYFNTNVRSNLTGTAVTYFGLRNFEIAKGRMFREGEVNQNARVAVIGSDTALNLFGTRDPLEQTIKVNGINFKVIGVLKSKGDQGWFNPDDQTIVPYTTAMKQVLGLEYLREVDMEVVQGADMEAVQDKATVILRRNHKIPDDQPDDFNIRNQAEFIETAQNFSRIFTFLLGGIASISLLVGGIGIMNIMLVTVTERTREIGIRKAIGAKQRDILLQFLLEAMFLSSVGGLLGVIMGVLVALLIDVFTEFPTILEPFSIILAFSFAMGVGVFFGYYPAHRASRLSPIEALRYE